MCFLYAMACLKISYMFKRHKTVQYNQHIIVQRYRYGGKRLYLCIHVHVYL